MALERDGSGAAEGAAFEGSHQLNLVGVGSMGWHITGLHGSLDLDKKGSGRAPARESGALRKGTANLLRIQGLLGRYSYLLFRSF